MHLTNPGTFPIENPQTPQGKEAAALHAKWVEEHAQVAFLKAEAEAAQRGVREADADLQRAVFAEQAEGKSIPRKVTSAMDQARDRAAEPWAHRISARSQVATNAYNALRTYVRDNIEHIVPELEAEAVANRDGLIREMEAVRDRIESIRSVNRRLETFGAWAGGPYLDAPNLGVVGEARLFVDNFLGRTEYVQLSELADLNLFLEVRDGVEPEPRDLSHLSRAGRAMSI